jgi:maltose-binding protein MalE
VFISAFVLQISSAQQLLKQSKLTTLNESFLLLLPHPPKEKKKRKKQNKMTQHFIPSLMTQQIPQTPKMKHVFLVFVVNS